MDIPSKNKPAAGRYALLDELRGLDLLSMIGYHACWDLIFLFGMSATWYTGWQGHLWQQSICWVFILLSGFCLPLGHRPLRRGLIVSGAGVLVTAVTLLFMPEDRVVFGVLTLLGAAALLWSAVLMVLGLKVVHEFSFGRTVLAVLYSLIGILIILFLALLLWSLFQQLAMFLVSLYDELSLKLK